MSLLPDTAALDFQTMVGKPCLAFLRMVLCLFVPYWCLCMASLIPHHIHTSMLLVWVALFQHPEISSQKKGGSDMVRLGWGSPPSCVGRMLLYACITKRGVAFPPTFPSSFVRVLSRGDPGEEPRRGGYGFILIDAFLPIWMPLHHSMSCFWCSGPVLLEGPLLYFPPTSQALVMVSLGVEAAF